MAAAPMPDPGQSQAPGAGGAQGAPSGAPASPQLMQLAAIHQHLVQMAQDSPAAASGLAKATQGITEAMSALVSQPQQSSPSQSPSY